MFGWDDRRIAERLGYKWESYRTFRRRHPELGPINDPVEKEREALAGLSRSAVRNGAKK